MVEKKISHTTLHVHAVFITLSSDNFSLQNINLPNINLFDT